MTISTEERNLLDFAERVTRSDAPYYAALFSLDRLSEGMNTNALTCILEHSIDSFGRKHGGRIYKLLDRHLMLICEASLRLKVNSFIMELENTLPNQADGMNAQGTFVELYDISATPNLFLKCCQEFYEDALELEERQNLKKNSAENANLPPAPITGQLLDRILNSLKSCDISPLIRRQNVCAMSNEGAPKSLFREYFVSMLELSRSIAPGVSVTSNAGLFRELTRALDRRFLKLLQEDPDRFTRGTSSFNMNMSTLKSNGFHQFLEEVVPNASGNIVVELDFLDVLEHMQDYQALLPFLKRRGLKVLLENLRPPLMPLVDFKRLDADLYKIRWQKAYGQNPAQRSMFLRALDQIPGNRCILTHCDSSQAIQAGRSAGIQAYQGFYVDSLQNRTSPSSSQTEDSLFPTPAFS